jgi:disulfide bond formation protein DsbB
VSFDLAALSRLAAPRTAALLLLAAAAGTIAGAWTYESLGYPPCDLCLQERIPYYAAMPLAALTALAAGRGRGGLARAGLMVLALLFAIGAGLAVYHTGVELKLIAGPSDCTGAIQKAGSVEDFLAQLQSVKVVRCDEPSLWVLGLTLANWNVLISLALAGFAGFVARLFDRAPSGSKINQ